MTLNVRSLAWVFPSVILVFACSIVPQESAGTPVPSGGILFQDDFSDEEGGWDSSSDEFGTTDYSDGMYLISVADAMTYLYSDPDIPRSFTDVRIEVDVAESDDVMHDMGILCRIEDPENFYYFVISSDGYYAIGKFKDGEDMLIGSEEMLADEDGVIHTGIAGNRLRADCIGDTLTLYANGEKLHEVQDSDFDEGNVGLVAGSYEDVPITVLFDDFVVTQP